MFKAYFLYIIDTTLVCRFYLESDSFDYDEYGDYGDYDSGEGTYMNYFRLE